MPKTPDTDKTAPGTTPDPDTLDREALKAAIITAGANNYFDAIDPTVLPIARNMDPQRRTALLDSIGGLTYVGMRDDHHRPLYIVTGSTGADYQRRLNSFPRTIVASTGSDNAFTVTEQQAPDGRTSYQLIAFDILTGDTVDGIDHGTVVLTQDMSPGQLITFGAQLQHIGAQALYADRTAHPYTH